MGKYTTPFYAAKSAYHILNILLYPGIDNEISRICYEKKSLPLYLLSHTEELFAVYRTVFTAMCKYQHMHEGRESFRVFRKDRVQDVEMVEHRSSYAFTSCSLRNEGEEYFLKKNGILLLKYELSDSVPYIVMNDVLGENPYQHQEEVLLPPFMSFRYSPLAFTETSRS